MADADEIDSPDGLGISARMQRRRRRILFGWGVRWGLGGLLLAYLVSTHGQLARYAWLAIPFAFASLALQLYMEKRLERRMRASNLQPQNPADKTESH